MRKDVIRGVRWAMLLSAVAIASIIVDRAIRAMPANAEAPVSVHEEAVAPVEEPVRELPAVAAPALERRVSNGNKPAQLPVRLDPVPAPPSLPPLADAAIFPHPAPPRVIALARPQEMPAALVEQPIAAPVVTLNPVPERVTNYSESSEKAPATNPAVRAVRSVGRLFGLGRKEKEAPPSVGK